MTLNILDNDTDADAPQSELFIDSFNAPTYGNVTLSSDQRTLIYTPSSADFTGSDVFTYTVSDAAGGTASASVWVRIKLAAPTAPSDVTVVNGQNNRAQVSWNDNSSNESRFELEREKLDSNGNVTNIRTLLVRSNATSLADYTGSTFVRYRVRATNWTGKSEWTDWSDTTQVTYGAASTASVGSSATARRSRWSR